MFRMRVPEGINAFYEDLKLGDNPIYQVETEFMPVNITYLGNLFNHVRHVQPFIESGEMKGSLVQIESELRFCQVNFDQNEIYDSYVLGGEISLVYIEGAIVNATTNTF